MKKFYRDFMELIQKFFTLLLSNSISIRDAILEVRDSIRFNDYGSIKIADAISYLRLNPTINNYIMFPEEPQPKIEFDYFSTDFRGYLESQEINYPNWRIEFTTRLDKHGFRYEHFLILKNLFSGKTYNYVLRRNSDLRELCDIIISSKIIASQSIQKDFDKLFLEADDIKPIKTFLDIRRY